MAFNPNFYGYQPQQFYPGPMPDQLAQYRQAQQPPIMQPPVQTAPAQPGGIVWVANEMEAYSYPVPPNSAAQLWNMNEPVVYLKKADAAGKPSITTYDLVERTAAPRPVSGPSEASSGDPVDYVTREEFNALAALVARLEPKEKPMRKGKEADA